MTIYQIPFNLNKTDYPSWDLEDKTLNGDVTGVVRFFSTDFKLIGNTELSFEIIENKIMLRPFCHIRVHIILI